MIKYRYILLEMGVLWGYEIIQFFDTQKISKKASGEADFNVFWVDRKSSACVPNKKEETMGITEKFFSYTQTKEKDRNKGKFLMIFWI